MLTNQMFKAVGRVLAVAFLWAAMTAGFAAPHDEWHLFPIKNGELVGFIDVNGTVIIPPQYKEVFRFSEGLAPARAADSGKWGYIDQTGSFVIPPQYKEARLFSDGLAQVKFEPAGGGYIDYSGRVVFQGDGGYVRNGMVALRTKEKTIFADKSGVTLFEVMGAAWQVGGGLIAFIENEQMGFMNRDGRIVIQPAYHRVVFWGDEQFAEQITPVSIGPREKPLYGFIDRTGKVVVDFQFEWAGQFSGGLAAVVKEGKFGYVNTAGEVVIVPQFIGAFPFSEGLAAVKTGDNRWGFIDTQGRMVIAPQYLLRLGGFPMVFSEGLAAVRTEAGMGFINRDGEMVVPAVYKGVRDFSGGLAQVWFFDGTSAYINREGVVVWPRAIILP